MFALKTYDNLFRYIRSLQKFFNITKSFSIYNEHNGLKIKENFIPKQIYICGKFITENSIA